jgi:hypothetical protein
MARRAYPPGQFVSLLALIPLVALTVIPPAVRSVGMLAAHLLFL